MKKSLYLLLATLIFCIATLKAQEPNWQWGRKITSSQAPVSVNMALDKAGNLFIIGHFSDTLTVDNRTLYPAPGSQPSIFLSKYNANGQLLWLKSVGRVGQGACFGINIGKSGNIYLNGNFQGVDLFTPASFLFSRAFVAKYDADGNYLWSRYASNTVGTSVSYYNVAINDAEEIVIGGGFTHSLVLGTDTLTGFNDYNKFTPFLVKYDSAGNQKWCSAPLGNGFYRRVIMDAAGNMYCTGRLLDTLIFNQNTRVTAGNMLLVKYAPNGQVIWAKSGTGTEPQGNDLTTDKAGNVYQAGDFGRGWMKIEGDSIGGNFYKSNYLAMYDRPATCSG